MKRPGLRARPMSSSAVVSTPPISDEVAAAFAAYHHGGLGLSHSKLTTIFAAGGYAADDPYIPAEGIPNKEKRVYTVLSAAIRRPQTARRLVDAFLTQLRVAGYFDKEWSGYDAQNFKALRQALQRSGWDLAEDGILSPLGIIDLSTGGRDALDEHISRLRHSTDDPGALLGSAKDLLESTAKFVLEEVGMPAGNTASFDAIWHIARDRLGVLPQQVDTTLPGGSELKAILQSSWKIAEQVNALRNLQGAGHGRTLPTGVSPEMALLVVREACSVAEFMLTTLDRQMGRR